MQPIKSLEFIFQALVQKCVTYLATTIVIRNMAKIDVKVVMLGKEYSGKTSIVERFLSESFGGENKYQSTIGVAYGARYLQCSLVK